MKEKIKINFKKTKFPQPKLPLPCKLAYTTFHNALQTLLWESFAPDVCLSGHTSVYEHVNAYFMSECFAFFSSGYILFIQQQNTYPALEVK
jgi:hypothetical protein